MKTYPPQIKSFERQICAQTQDLQIFKKFNMSQMNPKKAFHNIISSTTLHCRSLPLKKKEQSVLRRKPKLLNIPFSFFITHQIFIFFNIKQTMEILEFSYLLIFFCWGHGPEMFGGFPVLRTLRSEILPEPDTG